MALKKPSFPPMQNAAHSVEPARRVQTQILKMKGHCDHFRNSGEYLHSAALSHPVTEHGKKIISTIFRVKITNVLSASLRRAVRASE
jgi:hypothetical protein